MGTLFATVQSQMPNTDHVKTFRLFELSQADSAGKDFQLRDWEKEHLQVCAECQGIVHVFRRQFEGQDWESSDMSTARFSAGNHVEIIGPGNHVGKHGIIVDVVESQAGDFVYRYRVQFDDRTLHTFFGFELRQEAA
jgi:hypothetical protein